MAVPDHTRTAALQILRELTADPNAEFHRDQLEAVSALVDERRRTLVVQRTGWGKSAVYFVATALLRRAGSGPVLLVSPLLALMRDQVAAARRAGVRAVAINSATATEWDQAREQLAADEVDILLISPERLTNPRFREEQLPDLVAKIGMLVVDEAHCISDWGHDFRPDYRRLARLVADLPEQVPVLATTATANTRVVEDVAEQLGHDVHVVRGPLARDSLRLGCLQLDSTRERLGWLAAHLGDLQGSGIVYALTVSAAEDTARMLREGGHDVRAYTGRTDPAERAELEDALRHNRVKALVATSALGMGFDKPDLGFVVHLGAPSSPVAYYQQVGRAGRATDSADVLLLPGSEDREIWRYFATASMPDPAHADAVLAELGAEPVSTVALETRVDVRRTRLELLLKVLDVDGAVQRTPGGWVATGQPWTYDAERYERIAQARSHEERAMVEYQSGQQCRMAFLTSQLDDPATQPCGRCDVCAGPWYPSDVPDGVLANAGRAMQRAGVPIEPRLSWPSGVERLGVDVSGRIRAEERAEPGRVVARLSDLGWGGPLRQRFAPGVVDAAVDHELVRACVATLRDWEWAQRPTGVVAMPSLTRPELVSSVAEALARIGRLELLGTLDVDQQVPRRDQVGNSAFRLAAVWGRFGVGPQLAERVRTHGGPILLVDDLVDSRWSLTVAARALRLAGAESVLPFALAQRG